jgi:hypothetical protein
METFTMLVMNKPVELCKVSDHLAALRERDSKIVEFGSILESIDLILSAGEEPSDFMMSFPLVRETWDRCEQIAQLIFQRDSIHEESLRQAEQFTALAAERDDLQKMLVAGEPPYYTKWKEVTAERDRLNAMLNIIASKIHDLALAAERDELSALLQDWLNFSVDVACSDYPGAEWLISLKQKTSAALKQTEGGGEWLKEKHK